MDSKQQMDNLAAGLESLFKPEDEDAMMFLASLFTFAQQIDDHYDGENTDKTKAVELHFFALSKLYGNPFFKEYGHKLTPLLESGFLQWQSANVIEAAGEANEKSYMLRAFYYQIVHYSASLLYGQKYAVDNAIAFQRFYGETYNDYIKEINDA